MGGSSDSTDSMALALAQVALQTSYANLALNRHLPVFSSVVPGLVQMKLGELFNRKSRIGALTFLETEMFAHEILVDAFYRGATVYGGAVRKGEPPLSSHAVPRCEFFRWVDALPDPSSIAAARLRAAASPSEVYQAACVYVLAPLQERIGQWAERLGVPEGDLFRDAALISGMGFRTEFVLDALSMDLLRDERTEALVEREGIRTEDEALEFVRTRAKPAPEAAIHPWPHDQRCFCGADLRKYAFCCDPGTPIAVGEHQSRLEPGYRIPCEQCGDTLGGVRCDSCQRVHTWDVGVVPTHGTTQ